MNILILTISLLLNFPTTPNYDNNSFSDPINKNEIKNIELGSIFFKNETDEIMFVDFASISIQILEVKITKEGSEFIFEDVAELDQEMIYEIELTILEKGYYKIELTLEDYSIISKELLID